MVSRDGPQIERLFLRGTQIKMRKIFRGTHNVRFWSSGTETAFSGPDKKTDSSLDTIQFDLRFIKYQNRLRNKEVNIGST